MVELSDNLVIMLVVGGFSSVVIVRILSFVIKSRCTKIKCLCGECERDVITSTDIDKDVIRDIEIPESLVKLKK